MRLPKADSHRISIAFFITLFSALVLCLCIFCVGGSSAVAEQKPYSELISDYCSFSTPARIAVCDGKIAVFDGGRIVQQGTHTELLKDEEGRYRALWDAQAQYYVAQ